MTWAATIAIVVGSVLDAVSTRAALRAGAREANPVMRAFGSRWIWARFGFAAAMVAVVWTYPEAAWAGLVAGAAFAALAVWNWRVARRQRGAH